MAGNTECIGLDEIINGNGAFMLLIGIAATRVLTDAEAEAAFNALMSGEATPAQIGGFLMTLRTRGEDAYRAMLQAEVDLKAITP